MPRPSRSNDPSLLGCTLDNGRLKVISELGSGSFAQVYKAQLIDSPTTFYAVKALFKSGLSKTQLQAHKNEVRYLTALSDHPNVCRLEKVIETEHSLYLVMELCDIDLFDLIVPPNSTKAQRKGLEEDKVLSIFYQLVSVLDYSHSNQIYHRDLKPENILLIKETLTVKLADFGLGTQSRISREFGCGSVRYMSPECLDSKLAGEGYSPEMNDVWGLGIILINLLTGKNPWVEPRLTDINYSLYLSENQAVSTLKSQFKLSHELAVVLSRVFSPDRYRRLNLRSFADAIREVKHLRAPVVVPSSAPIAIPSLTSSPPKSSSPFALSWNSADSSPVFHGFFNIPYLKGQANPNPPKTTALPPLASEGLENNQKQ
jgi:serine/threonine protein kinase